MATKSPTVNVAAGTNWETALLDLLGAPKTAGNYKFLNAWATREHGPSYPASLYANNPFFTTAGGGGSAGPLKAGTFPTIAGTPGVTRFPDVTSGVVGTGFTLKGYPGIVSALKSGNPEQYAGNAEFQRELASWSGGGYSSLNVAGQPGAPEGPGLNTPIEGASASDFTSISGVGIPPFIKGIVTAPAQVFQGVTGKNVGASPTGPGSALGDLGAAGSGLAKFLGINLPKNALLRGGEMVAGGVLILLGIVIVGKGAASSSPVAQTQQAARTVTRSSGGSSTRRRTSGGARPSSASPDLAAARVATERERGKAVRARRRRDLEASRETRAAREARDRRMLFEGATAAQSASQRAPGPARRPAKPRAKGRRAKR